MNWEHGLHQIRKNMFYYKCNSCSCEIENDFDKLWKLLNSITDSDIRNNNYKHKNCNGIFIKLER